MPWTAPKTWGTFEVPTSANLNTHIRDNLEFLYEVIFDGILLGDTALWTSPTFTFDADYSSYKSMVVVLSARSSIAATSDTIGMRLNGDSGANYDWQYINAVDAATGAGEGIAQTSLYLGNVPGSTADAGMFGPVHAQVPNYNLANRPKHCISLSGNVRTTGAAGQGQVVQTASAWRTGDAITSISLFCGGGNIKTGSRISIYGDLL